MGASVKGLLKENAAFLKELPPNFNMIDIQFRIEEKTPYMIVAIQECEKMNTLLDEIRFSLTELD